MAECKTNAKPTVTTFVPFDAESDAKALYKAMKGFGTDEKAIIKIVGNRTSAQLKAVEETFKTAFGKCLQKWIKKEISGKRADSDTHAVYQVE